MADRLTERLDLELATESIVVRIRWFGIVMGYILVQTRTGLHDPSAVRAFLALGAGYAALDTAFHRMGEVFLSRVPLFVSLMESIFIALLCYHDTGLDSPFRWYFLLSTLCCAIRYRRGLAWSTCGFHAVSLLGLALILGKLSTARLDLMITLAILVWVTWASSSLAGLLRQAGARLTSLIAELERSKEELERRVEERTNALRASQARSVHQEKLAAFGLLAAGIAHEVGNPLASLSSLLQILRRKDPDPFTAEKLDLADRQLGRIQRTIRELVGFSRPASSTFSRFRASEVVEEALGIAKYYHRTKDRTILSDVPADLPPIRAVRDHLTQVVLNLLLNAVDATEPGGRIRITARRDEGCLEILVEDDGRGIPHEDQERIFRPYFTTKPRGTGLGLFVCKQIVEESAGTVAFESEPGQGTTFRVRLPLEHNQPPRLDEPVSGDLVGGGCR